MGGVNIKTIAHKNPQEFLSLTESLLMQDEVINNLPLGILKRLVDGGTGNTEPLMVAITDDDAVRMCLLKTTSHLVISAPKDEHLVDAADKAVEYVLTELAGEVEIDSVIGQLDIADAFVDSWQQRTGGRVSVEMGQRIYRLDKVTQVPSCPGEMRPAGEEDFEMAARWIHAFSAEAVEEITHGQARELARRHLREGSLFIWQDKQPVAMAASSRPSTNGIVINLVYTPPESRRKGYATACVAALSRHLLDKGYKFCSLYTDLANPTSNSIYMKIGYYPVADSVVYRLHKK